MLNRMQLKAARAWLDLSQDELAAVSGVAKRTIARIELGSAVSYDRTIRDLQTTLEQKGIEFLFENGRGVGIRAKPQTHGGASE
ncbi:helix-turn-helix domain-containing protein [Bosea thiooxidans]